MNNTITIKQLSGQLGIDYVDARGIVNYLVHAGKAKQVRTVKTAVKGKPSAVFEMPRTITFELPEMTSPVDVVVPVAATDAAPKTEAVVSQ